jgi:UDP-3-O-[3-hydroxymyristoyl] N-acetylglucosamine deacetylase
LQQVSRDSSRVKVAAQDMRLASQLTIASPVEVDGIGLHTGEKSLVRIVPESQPVGISFIVGEMQIAAVPENVSNSSRQTALSNGMASVQTVEHLLAALGGLGISHVRIYVTGPEVPALDGSAMGWVRLLEAAGTRHIGQPVPAPVLPHAITVEDDAGRLRAAPCDRYLISVSVDYRQVGKQSATLEVTPETFKREIAPARTFGFADEARAVFAAGLASGASLENVLVIHNGGFSSPPRLPDELARHKMLDLIGDLALVGVPLSVEIEAIRPSHRLNVQLARSLAQALHAQRPR